MMFTGKASPLSQQGIDTVQDRLGVEAPALWAVLTVETSGCGFLPERKPKILFERHWFSRLTDRQFDGDPRTADISNPSAGGYGAGGAFQYERLTRAMALDRDAALESTSWGLGQVMGFNAIKVGFAGVDALVNASLASEDAQLEAMAGFIEQGHLAVHLRNADWGKFAFYYNGSDFQKNRYDEKLALAHKRYQQGPLPDLTVRTVQLALMLLGYGGAKFVDGWYGENTQKALLKYQQDAGLPASGVPDTATLARLYADLGW